MRALALIMLIRSVAVAAPTQTVTIEAVPSQARVHRGDSFGIELRTTNTTSVPQSFRIMNCAWADSWRSDDAQLASTGVECDKNFEITLTLAPGDVDTRTLMVVAAKDASNGAHAVRFGFTPIGAKTTVWSTAASLQVIAVASDLKISDVHRKPREIAFTLTNTTSRPIQIADHLVLQHYPNYLWSDMTWMSATSCASTPPVCTTIAPGASITPAIWSGMTCTQCVCHANTFAEAGQYRLIAQSCDGTIDYVGAAVSLPPR
jgi:hypothetical protein